MLGKRKHMKSRKLYNSAKIANNCSKDSLLLPRKDENVNINTKKNKLGWGKNKLKKYDFLFLGKSHIKNKTMNEPIPTIG
jgi:hypothetical protein